MAWDEITLTIRSATCTRYEKHVNAAEARRSLLTYVRKQDLRINGSGQRGILFARGGGASNAPVKGTYDIR